MASFSERKSVLGVYALVERGNQPIRFEFASESRKDGGLASTSTGERRWSRGDFLTFALLCVVTVSLGCLRGATKPFWSDEIATARIAMSPSWQAMLDRSRLVDLNPPLEPAAVRLSFEIFGPHEFAGRLPSVLAYLCAVGCLFLFLRVRLPRTYAGAGALLLLCNADVAAYATEARPYGFLLAGIATALCAYDSLLREEHVVWARVGLAVSLLVVLQAHLFGTIAAASFALAEIVRSIRRKQIEAYTWAALLVPWVSCLDYIPLLHLQASGAGSPMVYEQQDRTSLRKGLSFYHHFLYLPLAPLTKALTLVMLCISFFPTRRFASYVCLLPELEVLFGGLLATPIAITLLLHVRAPESGFFFRYGIAAAYPAMILFAALVAWRGGSGRLLGYLFLGFTSIGCAVSFSDSLTSVHSVLRYGWLSAPHGTGDTGGVESLCPGLPLVMDDALQFLEADYQLTSEQRMVYLTDREEALRLDHENARESVAGMSRVFQTEHHVLDGKSFLATHAEFLLVARPDHRYWMYDEMLERHADMVALGRYRFAGRLSDIYRITQVGPSRIMGSSSCALPGSTGSSRVAVPGF